ncbi:tyrosine-type recombinase/integrase [Lentzea terrae]|uniref:tyrosine-type recombinase/integrase n=1 Tax=Lentzea terrae TaxID=2200761 RepID=UPI0018E57D3A|nr:site-specific integrase [Lentzea terrae]
MESTTEGTRRTFRRQGYETQTAAQNDLDKVRALLRLGEGSKEDAEAVSAMLDALEKDEPIPDYEETARKLRSGQNLVENLTIGEWLDIWQSQESHRRATELSYESHVRLYLKPKIGDVRVDRLTVAHISEMFAEINDDNDRIVANNEDRRALQARIKNTRIRADKRILKAKLDELPPFRRPVGPSSQARIHATLRAAMNDAIAEQKTTFNAAMHYTVSAKPPRPLVWTPERVEEWQRTGKRPGPVMVWTPEQAGIFLDYVAIHDSELEALWHLAVKRGPRRGELAGLPWTEYSALDATVTISTQLTEVDWEIVEGDPKSDAGERVIPLDEETNGHFRTRKARQAQRRLELGPAWVDSGRVFTLEDGSALRPSSISDRFERLYTAAGLPPIRLHDLRHTAATLMLAANIDMKVIQETLGHSQIQTTSNLYTSVLPKVARDAAEKTVALIPRAPARAPTKTPGHPSGTHKINRMNSEVREMTGA